MGLILPGSAAFQFCVDNIEVATLDSSTGGNAGTIVASASGSANVDGTAVTALTALACDCHLLTLEIGVSAPTNTNDNSQQIDVLIDRAGGTSWSSLIDDLLVGFTGDSRIVGQPVCFYFPIWIPAGASIGLQTRAGTTVQRSAAVAMRAYGRPTRPHLWWCGQAVETLGSVPASSKGTDIVPGASAAFGSWTTIGTSTRRYGAMQLGFQLPSTSVLSTSSYVWNIGYNSVQLPGTGIYRASGDTNERGNRMGQHVPTWCDIAAGTVIQGRVSSSIASPQNPSCCIYGVY